ncbi:MAG: outer membrane beta-barrel protein [Shimia sp.]|uniref:outer membrane protein n=1 Tax=Shimia sp. TaxID=1954381 RepID=UPI003B8D7759
MDIATVTTKRIVALAAAVVVISVVAGQTKADTWDGAYFGVQIGAGQTEFKEESAAGVAGVQVGRDWQVGEWVMGVGIDSSALNGGSAGTDFKSLSRLKLRGGYDFGGTLLYATTGASYGDHNLLGRDWGHFVGVGVEHKLSDNWSISGEIAQYNFSNFNGAGKVDPTVAAVSLNFRF